jgi:hypothetical protein
MKVKFTIVLLCIVGAMYGQKSFKGAEGFGTDSRGAYSGSATPAILIVDTLADGVFSTGVNRGTLEWAIQQKFPRIILFEVSGVIDLADDILVNQPYASIFGQSAPYPGITIKGSVFKVGADNVIIQHMKFRAGDDEKGHPRNSRDCFLIYGDKIVVDHCSFSWSIDELIEVRPGCGEVTISNSIFAEPLFRSYHFDEGSAKPEIHAYSFFSNDGDLTLKNNLFAFSMGRNPLIKTGKKAIINNLFYNTNYAGPMFYDRDGMVINANVVNNIVREIPGGMFTRVATKRIATIFENINPGSSFYFANNECQMLLDNPGLTQWACVEDRTGVTKSSSPVFPLDQYTVMSLDEAEAHILSSAGAFNWQRDYVDTRIIANVETNGNYLIDSPNSLPARVYNWTGINGGDMLNGYNFSADNRQLLVNGVQINLNLQCNSLNEIIALLNGQLPANIEAYSVYSGNLAPRYLGIRTLLSGSQQRIQISGNGAEIFGWETGTIYGSDGKGFDYTSKKVALKLPSNPHGDDDANGFTNLEHWVNIPANSTTGNTKPTISDQNFTIADTLPINSIIAKIAASDPDNGQTLSFTLISGNSNERYALSSKGILTLKNPIVTEKVITDVLNLQVMDNGEGNLTDNAQITITINHIPFGAGLNQYPSIEDQFFELYAENPEAIVGTLQYYEDDPGQTVQFEILHNQWSDFFNLNPSTGVLSLADNSIYDSGINQSFTFSVVVRDNGSPSLSDTALVGITIHTFQNTVYIDPSFEGDGLENGSLEYPYSGWSKVTWNDGFTYLQRRNTLAYEQRIVVSANNVHIGAYGTGNDPRIVSSSTDYAFRINDRQGIIISHLNVGAEDAESAFYFFGPENDSNTIENCTISGSVNGIRLIEGKNYFIRYNIFQDLNYGIYTFAAMNTIYYNSFSRTETAIMAANFSSEIKAYNNVFYENHQCISSSYGGLTLYNNIFRLSMPGSTAISQVLDEIVSDHNLFYPEQEGFIEIAGTKYNSLNELKKYRSNDHKSVSNDPLFVDENAGDFMIEESSPTVDAGVNLGLEKDIAGKEVPFGKAVDIGLYELPFTPSATESEHLEFSSHDIPVYPNPNNGIFSLNITHEDVSGYARILIFDSNGQEVFSNGSFMTGIHHFNLTNLKSGNYFVSIRIEEEEITQKIIITR